MQTKNQNDHKGDKNDDELSLVTCYKYVIPWVHITTSVSKKILRIKKGT